MGNRNRMMGRQTEFTSIVIKMYTYLYLLAIIENAQINEINYTYSPSRYFRPTLQPSDRKVGRKLRNTRINLK